LQKGLLCPIIPEADDMMTDGPQASRSGRWDAVLLTLLALSLALNVVLGLAYDRRASEARLVPALNAGPVPGTRVPPLEIENPAGAKAVIRFDTDTRSTVIYVSNPNCQWCSRNLANIRELSKSAADSFTFVGISLGPTTAAYLQAIQLPFDVFTRPSAQTMATFGLRGTPHTIVVAPDGTVQKSWPGAYTGSVGREIEEFFHVTLPGLTGPADNREFGSSGVSKGERHE
jgi:hypothetical protein